MYDERIILQIEMANPEADVQSQSRGRVEGCSVLIKKMSLKVNKISNFVWKIKVKVLQA